MSYLPPVSQYIFGILPSSLPQTVDLRPKCSPVSNQGDLDSCVAFAFIGAMEYLENLQNDSFISLSQQFVFYNERVLEGTASIDTGTYMSDGLKVLTTYGACELSLWPYNDANAYTQPPQAAYTDAAKRKALQYSVISQTQNAVMTSLASGYPVAFGFLAYASFESAAVAATGMVPMPGSTEAVLGGHAMLIVGYDLANQLFLVRNSWGTGWGLNGYCWMPFAYILSPNLVSSLYSIEKINWPAAPVAPVTPPTPVTPVCPVCPSAWPMSKH